MRARSSPSSSHSCREKGRKINQSSLETTDNGNSRFLEKYWELSHMYSWFHSLLRSLWNICVGRDASYKGVISTFLVPSWGTCTELSFGTKIMEIAPSYEGPCPTKISHISYHKYRDGFESFLWITLQAATTERGEVERGLEGWGEGLTTSSPSQRERTCAEWSCPAWGRLLSWGWASWASVSVQSRPH